LSQPRIEQRQSGDFATILPGRFKKLWFVILGVGKTDQPKPGMPHTIDALTAILDARCDALR
jgi:hypothetical protein